MGDQSHFCNSWHRLNGNKTLLPYISKTKMLQHIIKVNDDCLCSLIQSLATAFHTYALGDARQRSDRIQETQYLTSVTMGLDEDFRKVIWQDPK
jgi:hypothetical protein